MKKAAVFGSFVVDLMARTPHLPEPGETVMGSFFRAGPGGKGANQAAAAKRAGCELVFSTKLGQDDFAGIALESFRRDGIGLEYVFQTGEAPTGAALISVDEGSGQNEIVVVLGACATYQDKDIIRLETALEGCEYLLLQLEINIDAIEKLIRLAAEKGSRVILNPAPVQPLSEEIYRSLYLVTPNEVEARILTGVACDDLAGCQKAAEVFFRRGSKEGDHHPGEPGGLSQRPDRGSTNYDVPVLDTTGAGDAFNGGLLAGLSQGLSFRNAAVYGNVVANLAVTKLGTAPAMPSIEEIEAFIRKNNICLS